VAKVFGLGWFLQVCAGPFVQWGAAHERIVVLRDAQEVSGNFIAVVWDTLWGAGGGGDYVWDCCCYEGKFVALLEYINVLSDYVGFKQFGWLPSSHYLPIQESCGIGSGVETQAPIVVRYRSVSDADRPVTLNISIHTCHKTQAPSYKVFQVMRLVKPRVLLDEFIESGWCLRACGQVFGVNFL
jgi:hypothetical protein